MREMSLSSLFIEFSLAPLTLYPIIQIIIHYCHFFCIHSIFRIYIIIISVRCHHCFSELHTLKFPFWDFTLLIYLTLSFLHLITFFHSSSFFQFKRLGELSHFLLYAFWLPLTFCIENFPFLLEYSLTYTFVFFKWFR